MTYFRELCSVLIQVVIDIDLRIFYLLESSKEFLNLYEAIFSRE